MSDSEEVIPEKKGRGRPPAGDKADKVTDTFVIMLKRYQFFVFVET